MALFGQGRADGCREAPFATTYYRPTVIFEGELLDLPLLRRFSLWVSTIFPNHDVSATAGTYGVNAVVNSKTCVTAKHPPSILQSDPHLDPTEETEGGGIHFFWTPAAAAKSIYFPFLVKQHKTTHAFWVGTNKKKTFQLGENTHYVLFLIFDFGLNILSFLERVFVSVLLSTCGKKFFLKKVNLPAAAKAS